MAIDSSVIEGTLAVSGIIAGLILSAWAMKAAESETARVPVERPVPLRKSA